MRVEPEIVASDRICNSDSCTNNTRAHLSRDKTFYHHPDPSQAFGFVLLFFDAGCFADLIDGALLITHELSMTLQLFRKASSSVIVFFDLSL